jgi:hypothetical protein
MEQKAWLESTDPREMLRHLGAAASNRKLRLFACACCRRAWHFVTDKRLEPILLLLEGLADGTVKTARLRPIQARSYKLTSAEIGDAQQSVAWEMWGGLRKSFVRGDNDLGESAAAAFGYAAGKSDAKFFSAKRAERAQQTKLIHEMFGDPFAPVALDLAWCTDTVLALARQMYDGREFGVAPILADALQDAGCDSDDLLVHLRDLKAAHVRGCWALDLVLGKE